MFCETGSVADGPEAAGREGWRLEKVRCAAAPGLSSAVLQELERSGPDGRLEAESRGAPGSAGWKLRGRRAEGERQVERGPRGREDSVVQRGHLGKGEGREDGGEEQERRGRGGEAGGPLSSGVCGHSAGDAGAGSLRSEPRTCMKLFASPGETV